jgi:hypothetical protein
MKVEFDGVQSELKTLIEERRDLHDKAVAEFNQLNVQKSPPGVKNKIDSNAGTSHIESLSQDEYPETAVNHSKTSKPGRKVKRESDSDSIFDREDADENLLKTHLNRPEREKVKNLFDQMTAQELEGKAEKERVSNIKKEQNSQFGFEDINGDFDKEEESESEEDEILVKAVNSAEVKPFVKIILQHCEDNGVDIMEVQNIILGSDFSLTRKISVSELTKLLVSKFGFPSYNATLLARYMVEQPESFTQDRNNDSPTKYEFDDDAKLSHAKVISRLQSVMSTLSME